MTRAMRINHYSTNHKGNQPIRVLQHNIIHQFENANPTFLALTRTVIQDKKLQAGIGYHVNDKAIMEKVQGHTQTPYIDDKGKIYLHETFMSYVWCVCYSMLFLHEEAIAKPSQNQLLKTNHRIDSDGIDKAKELFDYAKSLITFFYEWDKENLPNPESYPVEEQFYIERANGLFVSATNFILCHEFAHAEYEHLKQRKEGKKSTADTLEFEKEADLRAMELVLEGVPNETKLTREIGVLMGLCSLLFLKQDSVTSSHPATDDRIHKLIEKINPSSASPHWGIAALAFNLWDNQFQKNFNMPNQVHDLKELYEHLREEIKKENEGQK